MVEDWWPENGRGGVGRIKGKLVAVNWDLRVGVASEKHPILGYGYLVFSAMMSDTAFKRFAGLMLFLGNNLFLFTTKRNWKAASASFTPNYTTWGCGV